MNGRDVVSYCVIAGLLVPCVTPHGLALQHQPKPWIVGIATASSTAKVVTAINLVTGQRLTAFERDYRHSMTTFPSST